MSDKSYWRGYVDAQDQKALYSKLPIATARRAGILKELSELTQLEIKQYRSGFMIELDNLDKTLPKKIDADYVKGWFAGQGRRIKKPKLKLTISGHNVEVFRELVKKIVGIELPKAQSPNRKVSKSMRVIVTDTKAYDLDKWLRA